MFLSWWRWLKGSPSQGNGSKKGRAFKRRSKFLQRLFVETLEDRTMLSTFQWTGLGADGNWSTAGNWNLVSGSGTTPNAVGDIARFAGTPAQTTVTVNVPVTVGEIDFNTASNINIVNSGGNVLTFQNSAGNA